MQWDAAHTKDWDFTSYEYADSLEQENERSPGLRDESGQLLLVCSEFLSKMMKKFEK